jgi:predicted membrane-bound mannosyltransferase/DNA-binding beta-propeller fold protein YncE
MAQLTTTPQQSEPTDFLSRPLIPAIGLDWEKAIYLVFIILAIVSRFWALGDRVMSHDESLHTQFSYQYFIGDGYSHTPLMHGPFLFHATSISYWLLGDSDFSARVPVAILGVLLVFIPYFLRDWLGKKGALFTSFLYLISPYLSYYSRYIRHDIYVIIWSLIVFIAIVYYLRESRSRYLWWFAAGLALMFSTKEVAFIYVAIFGSFLVLRLLATLAGAPWIREVWPRLRIPLLVALLGIVMVGAGFAAHTLSGDEVVTAGTATATEGFAVDPNAPTETEAPAQTTTTIFQWIELVGIAVFSAGVLLTIRGMRPHIDKYPESDLIMLFSTLLLPLTSPLLVRIAGYNPQGTTINRCMLEGQETMSSLQLFLARATNGMCIDSYLHSDYVVATIFLVLSIIVAVAIGLWWGGRRWLIAALIFNGIFLVLYTSVFTNPAGWRTGMIGSLGYWLEQQGVQRGSQPWYYYFFVTPFYEYLTIIFAIAGAYLWTKKERLNTIVWYWVWVALLGLLAFSLSNWLFNRSLENAADASMVPGLMAAGVVLLIGGLYWFLVRRRQIIIQYELTTGLRELVSLPNLVAFVPALIWWTLLTWFAYSYAGEKMPWLSTHFVIPMAMLAGWYFNERLSAVDARQLFTRRNLLALGVTMLLIVVMAVALGPLLLGTFRLGDQQAQNLIMGGRFLGGLLVAGLVGYACYRLYAQMAPNLRRMIITLAIFGVLSALTIRSSYMANYIFGDFTNEFMVYAHGAPATKHVVLDQLEEISMRQYGDTSIKVAYDSDVSWPFTWYLRDYPNRVFFGENPTQSLNESPVVIVGSRNWDKVDPFLANNYTSHDYTFLWWPMEDYRRFSWNALLGDANTEPRRGLGNPDVRQALWDIFFYRDYTKYGEVFGGTFTAGEWPLRHELRLYVRNDVLANIWDFGVGATTVAALEDPYEDGALALTPDLLINESGVAGSVPGALAAPRNVAVASDGEIYVADSGNNRIQVFAADGAFLREFGSAGAGPGQFNEPWGLAVDDAFVYVADTWNHRIQKFSRDGQLVNAFGASGAPAGDGSDQGLGLFFGPRDIVFLNANELAITDTGNHRIQVMDTDGNFLRQAGGLGSLPGQFNEPVGLGLGVDGSLFVADTWNGRIQQLDANLQPLAEFRVEAWYGQSINNKPYLATDSQGRIYVTDPEGYRVLIFSPIGEYLGRFGQYSADTAGFGLPNGIDVNAAGQIFVVDSGNNRLLRFAPLDFGDEEILVPERAP